MKLKLKKSVEESLSLNASTECRDSHEYSKLKTDDNIASSSQKAETSVAAIAEIDAHVENLCGHEVKGNTVLQHNVQASPDMNLKSLLKMLGDNFEFSFDGSMDATKSISEGIESEQSFQISSNGEESNVIFLNTQNLNFRSGSDTDVGRLSQSSSDTVISGKNMYCDMLPIGTLETSSRNEYSIGNAENIQSVQSQLYSQSAAPVAMNGARPEHCMSVGEERAAHAVCIPELPKLSKEPITCFEWYHDVSGAVRPNHSKLRKSRRRKSMARPFPDEFYMRSCPGKESASQIQMVKLVCRQKTAGLNLAEADKNEKSSSYTGEKVISPKADIKNSPEDQKLAFMKTIDMPSGKRVEDIYVVPPVWITDGKLNNIPGKAEEQDIQTSAQICCSGEKRPNFGDPFLKKLPQPTFLAGYEHLSLHSSYTLVNTKCGSPTNRFDGHPHLDLKGHIITTLNVSKMDPFPTLKDLCKMTLRSMHIYPVEENVFFERQSSFPNESRPVNTSSVVVEKTDRESNCSIQSPKEFIDMKGSLKRNDTQMGEKFNTLGDSLSKAGSSPGSDKDTDGNKSTKTSSSSENLPENPLWDDMKGTSKVPGALQDMSVHRIPSSDEHIKVEMEKSVKKECKASLKQGQIVHAAMSAGETKADSNIFYLTNNLTQGIPQQLNTEYIIPIVRCPNRECLDKAHNSSLTSEIVAESKSTESINSKNGNVSDATEERPGEALPFTNSPYFKFQRDFNCDSPCKGVTENSGNNLSLTSLSKQIKSLSLFEPLNKPLQNLSSTLTLLCNAEKTLSDVNFSTYKRVKCEYDSKLGHLNMCILKLADTVVTVGRTLQKWTEGSNSRCFVTMGVLTDLYNNNIIALIELITPYFHYICELITFSHSSMSQWREPMAVTEQFGACPTKKQPPHSVEKKWQGSQTLCLTDTSCTHTYSAASQQFKTHEVLHDHNQAGPFSTSVPNAMKYVQSQLNMSPKLQTSSAVRRGRPPGSKNGQKRSRVSLLKRPLSMRYKPIPFPKEKPTHFVGKSKILPNTILVNMSSKNIWSQPSATVLRPQSHASNAFFSQPLESLAPSKGSRQSFSTSSLTSSAMMGPSKVCSANASCEDGVTMDGVDQDEVFEPNNADNMTEKDKEVENLPRSSVMISCSPAKKTKFDPEDEESTTFVFSDVMVGVEDKVPHLAPETACSDSSHQTLKITPCSPPLHPPNTLATEGFTGTGDLDNLFIVKDESEIMPRQLDSQLLTSNLVNGIMDRGKEGTDHHDIQMALNLLSTPSKEESDSLGMILDNVNSHENITELDFSYP